MKSFRLVFAIIAIGVAILTTGCNSTENQTKNNTAANPVTAPPAKKEVALYTGQEAITRMMGLATKWSLDAQPARVESVSTTESSGQDGKSAVWRGFFASPMRRAVTTIICSGSRLKDAPPYGVSIEGHDRGYDADAANLAFMPLLVKTDTDKAYEIAQQHGGADLLKKDPQQQIAYVLLKDRKRGALVWYVIYGESESSRKGIGVINATTGAFVSASK